MTTGLVTNLPLADSMVLPRIGTAAFSSKGLLADAIRTAFAEEQISGLRHTLPRADDARRERSPAAICRRRCWRELAFDPTRADRRRSRRAASTSVLPASSMKNSSRCGPRAAALLVIGEDLEELLVLCDRIAVMYEGRIVGTLRERRCDDRAARPADDRRGEAGGLMFRLEARAVTPAWFNLALPLLAIAATLVVLCA